MREDVVVDKTTRFHSNPTPTFRQGGPYEGMEGTCTSRIDATLANHMANAMIIDIEYGWKLGSPDHVPIIIHCQPSNLSLNVIKSVDPKLIDVDGIEHLILEGGNKYLKNDKLKSLSVEINENFKDLPLKKH